MKKFLSLLLALTMLLSLTFAVSAANRGMVRLGDNNIELPWDSKEPSVYTFAATQTGTLYIMATEFYCAFGDTNYDDNSDNMNEWAWYTQLTVNGQPLENDYYGAVEVVAGQTYTFAWSHHPDVINESWYTMGWRAVLNLSYTDEAIPKLGSETLPVELYWDDCPRESIVIPAGGTAYYLLMDFDGGCFAVTGENACIITTAWGQDPVEHLAVDGVVTIDVEYGQTVVQIGNKGTEPAAFELDCYYVAGSEKNPVQLVIGSNVAVTKADNWEGYKFTFTAECDGALVLTFAEKGWMCSVRNVTADGWDEWHEPSGGNVIAVEAAAGDEIMISVIAFNGMMATGGDVVFEAAVAYNHNYVDGVCEHCGGTEASTLLGDVNCDGKVNARDARALLRHIAGLTEENEIDLAAADYNGDGKVNARDARAMLRAIAGLD